MGVENRLFLSVFKNHSPIGLVCRAGIPGKGKRDTLGENEAT